MVPRETIDAFKNGDEKAFELVLREYGRVVRGAASRFWTGAFDQEEAMQEIWLHIWKNRAAMDPERAGELSGFIAVTARRLCIDILRRKDAARPLEDTDDVGAEAPAPGVVEQNEIVSAARSFAASLKPSWRVFFDLHFIEGLDYEDVGARLKIGKLRCKYMKKVLAARARKDAGLLAALARLPSTAEAGGGRAS